MAWIESHQELGRHPKTRKLARLLGISIPTAIGHLHLFWWWAMDFAQDGNLDKYDSGDIADAALWDGDPEHFHSALVTATFIDIDAGGSRLIHDWNDYAGKLIERRKSDAQRKRGARLSESVRETSGGHPEDIQETAHRVHRNRTLPNHTVPSASVDRYKAREYASVAVATTHSRSQRTQVQKTPKPENIPREPRPRNPIWDTLCDVLHAEPQTRSEKSNWGKVVRNLTEAGATPEDIRTRARHFTLRYKLAPTINTLDNRWGELETLPAMNGKGDIHDGEAQRALAQEHEEIRAQKERDRRRVYEENMRLAREQAALDEQQHRA